MGKSLIINANNFGLSKYANSAILEGYNNGFLQSASICTNGEAFAAAVNDIIPECSQLSLGITLNLTSGKPITAAKHLVNKKGYFDKNFAFYVLKSNNPSILNEIEQEFRAQIERIVNVEKIDHIRSLDDIHAIPGIFRTVVKLADEYKIPYVQTHNEKFYTTDKYEKYLNLKFPVNFVKTMLLNIYTKENIVHLTENNSIKTNTHLISNLYKGMINSKILEDAINELDEDSITEISISPDKTKKQHKSEINVIIDKTLEYIINRLNITNTNYSKL